MSYVYDIISVNIPRYLSISDTSCFRAQTGQYLGWLVRARSAADTELVDWFSGRTANMRRQTAPVIPWKKWEESINWSLRERAIHNLTGPATGPAPDSCSTFNFPVVTLASVFTTPFTQRIDCARGKALATVNGACRCCRRCLKFWSKVTMYFLIGFIRLAFSNSRDPWHFVAPGRCQRANKWIGGQDCRRKVKGSRPCWTLF